MTPDAPSALTRGREYIRIEMEALQATAEALDASFVAVVTAVETAVAAGRKLIFSGVGKSAHIAQKLAGTFNSTGSVTLAPGDVVNLIGTYSEYYGKSEITIAGAADITVTGTTTIPAPALVQPADVIAGGADAESYEGVLVRVEDVACTNPDLGYGEFEVTGGLPVDDYFFVTGGGPSAARLCSMASWLGSFCRTWDAPC